ncbi:Rho GTPase-activating protein 21 [Bagarius yarrelli]|uniref:Rho GTPase-activating protein 21 n=1 Tax=Bagarius yarrelli TaxID=175774 RepID=A0A556V4S0_BAGYA|nr:Rho GTPase-activating protein 21 [Bagarius yarrelli]
MDTIFVKQVKEGGSAHQAGLCTGDRIVKVNSESIIGKTYSQVIALIQNSDASLELCVMPKDEDILQLAYSKDAYLKGNEAYSGNAQNIPEPPRICYPCIEPQTSGMTHTDEPSAPPEEHGVLSKGTAQISDVAYCSGQKDSDFPECSSHWHGTNANHRLQETENMPLCTSSLENLSSVRPRSRTTPSASSAKGKQFHYAPNRLLESSEFSTHIPLFHPGSTSTPSGRHAKSPFTPSPPAVASSPCSPMHQNIDWRNYTTYKEYIDNKRLYTYGSRTIQERLDSLRAASQANKANMSTESMNTTQTRQRSMCQERGPANSGVQSLCNVSQERLEAKERATSRNWHRSASQDAIPSSTRSTYKPRARSCDYLGRQAESRVSLMDRRVYGRTETEEKGLSCTKEEIRDCRQSLLVGKLAQTQNSQKNLDTYAASRSALIQNSRLDDSYVAKALASLNTGVTTASVTTKNQRTTLVSNHMSPKGQTDSLQEPTASTPYHDHSKSQRTQKEGSKVPAATGHEGTEATVVVVRREKTKKLGALPLRHLSYLQAVNDETGRVEKMTKTPKLQGSNDAVQDNLTHCFVQDYKPSGSGKLHESLDSIPFIDEPSSPSADVHDIHFPVCTVVSAAPPSPTSSSAILHRQLSHGQDSLRFTVLDSDSCSKTERSKSCDEGLDNYREEAHGKLLKHIDLKGLRKDKKEGQTPNSHMEEEPISISIRACLIDISYSDTKRKNVLRLTTSDYEASPPKEKGLRRKGIAGLKRKPFEKKAAPGVTFGARLDDCPPAHTNRLVEERGLEYTGIYRVPGNNAAISSMQEELNRGVGEIDTQEDLHELPDHHYETLKFLSAHLKTVAENSEKNKYNWFFTDDGEEEPETVVQTESAVETQPVPNIDHLLTNIGRTSVAPGEVSDSPTSDSAKSKGSWGSGKDQYSHELVSSIFAAANRKRKKPKEKLHASSSDDDLDAVFLQNELQDQKETEQESAGEFHGRKEPEKTSKEHKEHRNSFFLKKPTPIKILEFEKYSTLPNLRLRTALTKSSTSESPSQVEDLGIVKSRTSGSRNRTRIWNTVTSSPTDLPPSGSVGGSATAEVSSITSDYSTTSSMTFLTGAELSMLSADLQSRGGEEADDERSELISEGRHMETDSETEFPVFVRGTTTSVTHSRIVSKMSESPNVLKPLHYYILPSQRLTAFKRRSLNQKTDSESSLEAGAGREGKRISRSEPSRLSRVLEAVRKGRSVGSLNNASSSSPNHTERAKRPSITERLKSHFRLSADDMFGIGGQKNSKKREKRVRRRHTVGGQRDFGELAVINDWREQGGAEKWAELSETDRLKLENAREVFIRDSTRAGSQGSKAMTKTGEGSSHSASMRRCQSNVDQLNGEQPNCKGKSNVNSGSDAHPHKLSGAQVVRSQFYQCL